MKKKKIVITLCIVMILGLTAGCLGAWFIIRHKAMSALLEEVEWYNLDDKEFTITSSEELFDLATLSKYYDFKGQKIILGADIAVNEGNASDWANTAPEQVWMPITKFAGTFDGKGHTIRGIYAVGVNKSVGLFTDTQASCKIKDFRLENSYIKGLNDKGTGSIIGSGTGELDSIYSNAIVVCESDNCGGLVGYLKATKANTIENCWFDGSVEATSELASYTGGLIGRVLSNNSLCKILNCLNTADVVSKGQEIGGFIGAVAGETMMWLTDCLNVGNVQGAEDNLTAGMAIGKLYSSASITSKTSWVVKGNYTKAIGTTDGTVKGVLATIAKNEVQGFEAYINTTLDFDKNWSVVEQDTPVLTYFANTSPSVAGIERKYDISWFDEKSTQMHIETVAQLNGLALLSQAYGFSGQTIILDSDLVLNEGSAKDWEKIAPANEWTMPIGRWISEDGVTSGVAFSGTFDGNGHTISGLYIDLDSKKAYNWGLFAKTKGTIQNLRLENSYIGGIAGANVGSIAGGLEGATLQNVYSNAILDMDTWRLGGLTGIIEGRLKESKIINCWFDGSVSGRERVGGLVGNLNQDVILTVSHCLNSGTITSTSHYLGGFIGIINKCTASVTDSLNVGTVLRAEGNRSGYYGAISGGVNGDKGLECETTFKNVFYLEDSCTKGYQVDNNHKKYVTLVGNGVIQLNKEELTGKNAYAWSSLDFKNHWTTVTEDMPALRTFATTIQKASGTKMAEYDWYNVSSKNLKIKNEKQLWAFSILSRTDDFAEKTVELTKDIALNDTSNNTWYEAESLTNWKPIGRNVTEEGEAIGKAFAGTFDGKGHSISGLYIKLDSTKAFNWGLFAKISGKIQNLKVVDSHISGVAGGSVASITGSMAGATLENVYSNAKINITSGKDNTGKNIAGLAGIIEGKASSVITNCWFNGSASGVQRVGGFAGSIDKDSDLTISHGMNSGDIASESNYVGGFCGLMNKSAIVVTDSLNTGAISTTSKTPYIAAIVGGLNGAKDAEGKATFKDTYFLENSSAKAYQVDGNNAAYVSTNGNGVVLLKVDELTGNNAYVWSSLDFKTYWTAVDNAMPKLQIFAEKVQKPSGEKKVAFDWHDLTASKHAISNAKELWGLTLLSRTDNFSGEKISLVADISLKDEEWKPIGRYVNEDGVAQGKTFAGTFNGKGHEISDLHIELDSTKAFNWGLFAKVSGKIQNLKVVDSSITGVAGGSIGSVTGSMAGATLENIYSNATINITSEKENTGKNIAGLAGIIEGKASSTMKNCWFNGYVSGVERVGGFTGSIDAESDLTIEHGLNSGDVTSSSNYVGGFCGLMNKSAFDGADSLNVGVVSTTSKSSYVGAIVGGLNGGEGAEGAAAFNDVYYVDNSSKKAYQIDNNNKAYVEVSGVGVFGVSGKQIIGENALNSTTLDFENYWMTVENETPTLRLLENGSIAGKVSADISWYNVETTEFTISTKEELCGLALLSQSYSFENQKITLDNDVDLDGVIWRPIGQYVNEAGTTIGKTFKGIFNGNGNTISGLCIELDSSKASMYGLFGKVSGTVENLELKDLSIEGKASGKVGSVAGSLAGGTLKNIHSEVNVDIAANYAGGIVGIVESTAKGCIDSCYTTGNVSGNKHVGGLIGLVNGTANVDILHCQNDADVHSTGDYVGGLCGYVNKGTAVLEDCKNTGAVTTDSENASNQGAIIGCINGEDGGLANVTFNDVYYMEGNFSKAYHVASKDLTDGFVTLSGTGVVLLRGEEELLSKADFSWHDLSKTEFTINSAEQLIGLAFLSRTETFSGKTITLAADISLEGINWQPIGLHEYASGKSLGKVFAGTFDGNNHKITELTIEVTNGAKMYGLFGQVLGTIQNLIVEDCTIIGAASGKVGSVAGSISGGKLIKVESTANIDVSSNFVGGLAGCVEGNKKGTFTECIFNGSVEGNKHVGGLVGFANTNAQLTISKSQNSATVSTKVDDSNVGGLCGYVQQSTATITDSTNNGLVLLNDTNSKSGTIIGNINGDKDKEATVTFTNVTNRVFGGMQAYSVTDSDLENGYVTIDGYVADTSWYSADANVTNYIISTKEQLVGLVKLSETTDFAGKTIKLGADIALNHTTDTEETKWYERAIQWTPIGYCEPDAKNSKIFAGTFDGDNHKISGLYINANVSKGKMYGLFGQVIGTIQNLILTDCRIEDVYDSRVGSVAGSLSGATGKVKNVQVNASINVAANQVGGLVGMIESGATSAIENCRFVGSVTGVKNVGGLVGYVNTASITMKECVNTANVVSTNTAKDTRVGGLCGYVQDSAATIQDCMTTGEVTAEGGEPIYDGAVVGYIKVKSGKTVALTNIYYKANGEQSSYNTSAAITESGVQQTVDGIDINWYMVPGGKIASEAQLLGFAELAKVLDFKDQTVALSSNITLTSTNWEPIGYHEPNAKTYKIFAGTFEGGNYTISGLRIHATNNKLKMYGLFGQVSGTIQNLQMQDCQITGTYDSRVGSVAGSLKGTEARLLNVQSNATINVTANQVGGLVGMTESGSTSNLENCKFTGSVTGVKNTGGLVGYVNTSTIHLVNSQNEATVRSTSTDSKVKAGGLCGYVQKSTVYITDCVNKGTVSVAGTNTPYAGGIIGYLEGASNTVATVTFTNVSYLANGNQPAYAKASSNTSIVNPEQCTPIEE